jgi:hypothetical protein
VSVDSPIPPTRVTRPIHGDPRLPSEINPTYPARVGVSIASGRRRPVSGAARAPRWVCHPARVGGPRRRPPRRAETRHPGTCSSPRCPSARAVRQRSTRQTHTRLTEKRQKIELSN